MKAKILILLVSLVLMLAACGGSQSPTPVVEPSPLPTVTTAQPVEALQSPTATHTSPPPTTLAPTVLPSSTPVVPSPTPIPAVPTDTSTPAPSATPIPTDQPPPAPAFLSLRLNVPLMPPPAGRPDEPLLGVSALGVSAEVLAAGTEGNGVLISRNGGVDWAWSVDGLPAGGTITDLVITSGEMAALVDGVAYRSRNGFASWEMFPTLGQGVAQIAYSPAYASDGTLFAVRGGALLRSADNGASWVQVLPANGCPLNVVLPLDAAGAVVLAPRCDHLVRSDDGGLNWVDIPLESGESALGELTGLQAAPDFSSSGRLLAQGNIQGLPLISNDGGRNWSPAYDSDQAPFTLGALLATRFAPDGALIAVGRSYMYDPLISVWRSADDGGHWFPLARTQSVRGMGYSPDGALWLGTGDGLFSSTAGLWRWVHPGGSCLTLVEPPTPSGVAIQGQVVGKYTSKIRLFEKRDGRWQVVLEVTDNKNPKRAFPAPNYFEERLVLLLGQDYGGQIWALALRPDETEPLVLLDEALGGPGGGLMRYRVDYDGDYAASGRIELRHGHSGALFISDDRGVNWSRLDPAEPGACERNPVSGFGALWWANDALRNRLLCPLEDEKPFAGSGQHFERGELLRLEPLDPDSYDRWTYGFLPSGEGEGFWGTLPVYETDAVPPDAPAGLFPPAPIFHAAWLEGSCCFPDIRPVTEALGWGVGEAFNLDVARQSFEGGIMIWRGDRDEILVLEQTDAGDTYSVFLD